MTEKRRVMRGHHLTARIWATAALASTLLPASDRLGWWVPLHLALIGTATQLIVGGQLMFSSMLGTAPPPKDSVIRAQLVLLNLGAAGIIFGRVWSIDALLGVGATALLAGVAWGAISADRCWKQAPESRFKTTRTFYRLAAFSFINGSLMGAAMALGWLNTSYAEHKAAHLGFNLMGFAGLTVLGTLITFLPMMLRVRAPSTSGIKAVPWLVALGILLVTTGVTFSWELVSAAGAILIVAGFVPFAALVKKMTSMPRRRRVPVSALHALCALAWLVVTMIAQTVILAMGDLIALRNLWVVAMALGLVLQAVLGAWAYLLPMDQPAEPETRRRQLVAFEVGGRLQVVLYNAGLVILLASYFQIIPSSVSFVGLVLVLSAASFALLKSWFFTRIASTGFIAERSERWWTPLDKSGTTTGSD